MQWGSGVKVKVGIAPLWKSLWSGGQGGNWQSPFPVGQLFCALAFQQMWVFFHIYITAAHFVSNVIVSWCWVGWVLAPNGIGRKDGFCEHSGQSAATHCLHVLSSRLFLSQLQSHSEFWVSPHTVCMCRHFLNRSWFCEFVPPSRLAGEAKEARTGGYYVRGHYFCHGNHPRWNNSRWNHSRWNHSRWNHSRWNPSLWNNSRWNDSRWNHCHRNHSHLRILLLGIILVGIILIGIILVGMILVGIIIIGIILIGISLVGIICHHLQSYESSSSNESTIHSYL